MVVKGWRLMGRERTGCDELAERTNDAFEERRTGESRLVGIAREDLARHKAFELVFFVVCHHHQDHLQTKEGATNIRTSSSSP